MTNKTHSLSLPFVILASLLLHSVSAFAQGTLVGVTTDGGVNEINRRTGVLTPKATVSSNYDLGATARRGNILYSVGKPAGSDERAIYTTKIASGDVTVVDLDRNESVSALFLKGKKLYGIFSDDNIGTAGVFKINPKTGVTTSVVDLGDLDLDLVGGAIARFDNRYFTIGIDYGNSRRALVEFKLRAGSAKATPILDPDGAPALCERIKPHPSKPLFVCLAATSQTQTDIFSLNFRTGVAKFKATLTGIDRFGGGHTMSKVGNKYYALVYPAAITDSQTLITFNQAGAIRDQVDVGSIFVGARFAAED